MRQQNATYAAMVHSLDDAVGSLLDALDAEGIADETVIVFYSDNGSTRTAVNFPEVALPEHPGQHRLLHIHRNTPGMLSAINQALESVGTLGGSFEENVCKPTGEEIYDIPADLARDIARRIRDAADMGDVTALNAMADEIKADSDSCIPLSKQIIQMAGDFDLDGILKLAEALDAC